MHEKTVRHLLRLNLRIHPVLSRALEETRGRHAMQRMHECTCTVKTLWIIFGLNPIISIHCSSLNGLKPVQKSCVV